MRRDLAAVRLTELLDSGAARKASDAHLSPGLPPALRVDGVLEFQDAPAVAAEETESLCEVLFGADTLTELQRAGDVSAAYSAERMPVRAHAYRCSEGLALALRLLPAEIPRLEALGLPAIVASFADRPQGLVIFAGPTGSGKSTALAALVDRINRTQAKHILTIEDPVEYRHTSVKSMISHREVGIQTPAFADAVRGALRCDPDVILIGEMRDAATMHAAVTAAETGHLVLTTLHTGDAAQTVDRIVGAFAGEVQEQVRIQLAQTLVAVVCMRLVRRADGAGRRCAAEVLLGNDAARSLIRDGKTHQLRGIMETGRAAGMQTLEAHLSDMIAAGFISHQAARAACIRESELRIAGAGVS